MNDKPIVGNVVLPAVYNVNSYGTPPSGDIPNPIPRDIIKEIADDIGRETVAYVEVMYPEAFKAAAKSLKLSLRNHIYNEIMAAVDHNDVREIKRRLAERAKFRKEWVRQWRKIRRTSNSTDRG